MNKDTQSYCLLSEAARSVGVSDWSCHGDFAAGGIDLKQFRQSVVIGGIDISITNTCDAVYDLVIVVV